MNIRLLSIIAVLLLSLNGCDKCDGINSPKADCFCTLEYDPVCGCDGKTYGNACTAECSDVPEYEEGACKS